MIHHYALRIAHFALLVMLIFYMSNPVEAVPFTRTQMDKIFLDAGQAPSTNSTLDLNVETFKGKFNGLITPILQQTMGSNDVSTMAHLFLIKDYKIFSKTDGDLFANIFADYRVALVGLSESNGGNFKSLNLYYTTPEAKDESLFTVWFLTAFVKSITPDVDAQSLMGELTAENSSGTAIKSGVKYSISDEGNLNVLTAVKAE